MGQLIEHLGFQEETIEKAFEPYESFTRAFLDAFVVLDHTGKVVKFNQLFTKLLGIPSKQILRASSLTELFSLSIEGEGLSIFQLMEQPTPTRIDEIHLSSRNGKDLTIIMGIFPFRNSQGSLLGSFFLMRDVTAETSLQGKFETVKSQAITDALTGLFTRGYMNDYLDLVQKTAKQSPESADLRNVTLILTDVDHFKHVNDTYGHQAGDYVLQKVAEVARRSFRKTDIICRFGGEEFLIILQSTPLDMGRNAAEKLRQNIANEAFIFEGTKIPITMSFGVAQLKTDSEVYTETLSRADQALYSAKRTGRNKTCISE